MRGAWVSTTVQREFFNLRQIPFEGAPEQPFSYFSEQHSRAINLMGHAFWNKGCLVTILGEQGAGKSTLLRRFTAGLQSTAGLVLAGGDAGSLREAMLRELALGAGGGGTAVRDADIERACRSTLRSGRCLTVLVDDADRAGAPLAGELNWLGAVSEAGVPAVNFILIGETALEQRLAEDLRAVARDRQRHRFVIRRMAESETAYYIERRLRLAGAPHPRDLFTPSALHLVYRYTNGNPAAVNRLCHTAMNCALKRRMLYVSEREVALAIDLLRLELDPQQLEHPCRRQSDVPTGAMRSPARILHSCDGELLEEFAVDRQRILVGRDQGNDLVISCQGASRHHAVIFSNLHGLQLVDMHSTNGTFVNGQRINRRRLNHNDVIAIGSHRLKYINELQGRAEDDDGPGRDTAVLRTDSGSPVRRVK